MSDQALPDWIVAVAGKERPSPGPILPFAPSRIGAQIPLAVLFASDLLIGVFAALTVFLVYDAPLHHAPLELWLGIPAFVVFWLLSGWAQGLYTRATLLADLHRHLLCAATTWALCFGLLLLVGFGCNVFGIVSRVWMVGWALAVAAWLGHSRLVLRAYLSRKLARGGCYERAIILCGDAAEARQLASRVETESRGHIRAVATATLPASADRDGGGWLDDLVTRGAVERVIIGHFTDHVPACNAIVTRLRRLAIDVTLLPDLGLLQAPMLHVGRIGLLPAVELHVQPLSPPQALLKRAEDLLLGLLLLVAVAPLMLVVALAVRLDSPGPVLFRQERAGLNNRVFQVLKFRTMHAHLADPGSLRQTSRNDRRVTRVGRLLRRTSLDELPQLFNVLAGDMSLVGPRPHALGMTTVGLPVQEALADYTARHRLKPGITGLAQVNGSRGEVDSIGKLERRVALDCEYIENWSLGLDLWIMLRTALLVVRDSNAY